jgi:hypothetical protein
MIEPAELRTYSRINAVNAFALRKRGAVERKTHNCLAEQVERRQNFE